jgi:hypothetical protein
LAGIPHPTLLTVSTIDWVLLFFWERGVGFFLWVRGNNKIDGDGNVLRVFSRKELTIVETTY